MTNPSRPAARFRTTVTRRVIGALAGLALAGGLAAGPALTAAAADRTSATVRTTAASATDFVARLDARQTAALFDGIPNVAGTGLRFGDLTREQREASYALFQALLSAEAWTQLSDLVAADTAVGATDEYRVALFGDPAGDYVLQFSTAELSLSAIRQGDTIDVRPDLVV